MIKNIITWDLGATKCNVGLIEYDTENQHLHCKKTFVIKLAHTTSLADLVLQLEQGLNFSMQTADAICIGAAGFYDGQHLLLEGIYPYNMPFAALAAASNWPSYAIIHDYAPIVCSTFTSYMEKNNNVKYLNNATIKPHARRVAFGIGTGLGLKDGVLFPNGDFWLGENEAGHIGIPTPPLAEKEDLQRHQELIKFLLDNKVENHSALTFEKLLSGPGTVRLYQFFHSESDVLTPEQVGQKLRDGKAPETLDALAWYIGLFIGTIQLSFMPEGGIWITGGVSLNHLDVFDHPVLTQGIKSLPAYYSQREHYPLGVLCNQEHALMGGGYYASKRLLKS